MTRRTYVLVSTWLAAITLLIACQHGEPCTPDAWTISGASSLEERAAIEEGVQQSCRHASRAGYLPDDTEGLATITVVDELTCHPSAEGRACSVLDPASYRAHVQLLRGSPSALRHCAAHEMWHAILYRSAPTSGANTNTQHHDTMRRLGANISACHEGWRP
jgi:hypothetical protein